MGRLSTLVLKLPRDNAVTPEAAQVFLSALVDINPLEPHHRLIGRTRRVVALEIVLAQQEISFQITAQTDLIGFIETQLQAAYPLVEIETRGSRSVTRGSEIAYVSLASGHYYPIKTHVTFRDVDPLAPILAVLSSAGLSDLVTIQYALRSIPASWQARAERYASLGAKGEDGTYLPRADRDVIREKTRQPGFVVSTRVAANNRSLLSQITQSFNVFTRADGNQFVARRPLPIGKSRLRVNFNARKVVRGHILNTEELATLWHLPSEKLKTKSIAWGAAVLSEPPGNLPVHTSAEAGRGINFFARTSFKNRAQVFGIHDADRRRHVWVIGKTGTGKSTLIANMVIDDLKKGKGVAVIDPHGDLCELLLNYVPRRRINDVIYFNPADVDDALAVNPLQVSNPEEAEWVVSGMMSVFHKLYGYSWGPRLEYILRNTLLTLTGVPESTLRDVLILLTDKAFRGRVVERISDPVLKHFWMEEFEPMPDRLRQEAIVPILDKVGQFVTSPLIRRVIEHPTSSFSIDDVMNEGRILLANLSQGRLGEDNATLLGAMLITNFQLAAMRRVRAPDGQRRDYFLFVDEFQNFATRSFVEILSEARKYHLGLLLANQYVAQIPVEVQKAVLGNAGTLIAFAVGAEDARVLRQEFAQVFNETDLMNLANYQIAVKLMVEGHSQRPFLASTLPLAASRNLNRDKVLRISIQRWGRKGLVSRAKGVEVQTVRTSAVAGQSGVQ